MKDMFIFLKVVVVCMQKKTPKKTKSIRVDADAHEAAVNAGLKVSFVASRSLYDAANKHGTVRQKYPFELNTGVYRNWWIVLQTDSLGNIVTLFRGSLQKAKEEYKNHRYTKNDGYYIVMVESVLREVVN